MTLIFRVIRKLRVKLFNHLSTLIPIGDYKELQPVLFCGEGKVSFGEGTVLGYFPSAYYFTGYCHIEARHKDAVIQIGNNNHINNNLTIVAEHGNISIGDNCLAGTNVSIMNSDFHPISISKRHAQTQKSKDVVIGNNVFLGNNVSICKGVHIGDNAVVANGAVVFDDVAANTIVRGNPAVFYKKLND